MRIVVAGGSGFVGRHVVEALTARGHTVRVVDRGRRPLPAGVERVCCDLAAQDAPPSAFQDADAVVNLVGIKRAAGGQTFEGAHVGATARLIAGAQAQGIRRFVQVSVVCSRPDPGQPYHDTKWRAEELLRKSGLLFTILRPAVIFGEGDDMITHLVRMIRSAPVFPIVGRGRGLLQPVDVRDVAAAVALSLERPASLGRTYEVVGAARASLRAVVRTVARALGLRLLIVPTPVALLRPVIAAWSALSGRALSTPAQLRMLQDGLVGDPEPARRDLGLAPRAFDEEGVRRVAGGIGPLWGVSLRLGGGGERPPQARVSARAPWTLALCSVALLPVLSVFIPNIWYRLAANAAALMALALTTLRLPWAALFKPSLRLVALGVASGGLLYGAGALVARVLLAVPAGAAAAHAMFAWRDAVPPRLALPLLVWVVIGEEVVWRTGLTVALLARRGPWTAVLVSALVFAAAHLSLGQPLLVAVAFAAGAYWSALVVRFRSGVPALVSHLLWDLAVLYVRPYAGL